MTFYIKLFLMSLGVLSVIGAVIMGFEKLTNIMKGE
jgi:hypothetical protein